jgi:hypothetical protein
LGGSIKKIAKIRQMDDVALQDAVFEPILRDPIEIYRLVGPR